MRIINLFSLNISGISFTFSDLTKSQLSNMGVKGNKKQKSRALEDQSLNDFLETWNNDDSDEENEIQESAKSKKRKKGKPEKEVKAKKSKTEQADKVEKTKNVEPSSSSKKGGSKSSSSDGDLKKKESSSGARDHSQYIASLQSKDPEFYKFLKENDEELLNFDESSDEEGDGEEEDEDDEGPVHKLPSELEVASDESDFEDEPPSDGPSGGSGRKLTQATLDGWRRQLETKPTVGVITDLVEAFRAASATIGGADAEEAPARYVVEGGAMFNGVVRTCVVCLQPALKRILKVGAEDNSYKPEKAKGWRKVQKNVKLYLLELCRLMSRVTEGAVMAVLLKHVHQMIPFFLAFQKGAKCVLQRLTVSWCQGEETVRILAFMCIVKLVRSSPLLEPAMKQMYLAYVKNSKFTSPNTMPLISFMRRSLVELLGLDHNLAYYHAFVYIRQLAIHLRNAITTNKKDAIQAVYNWQFVHTLELWAALLGHTADSSTMQPLVYPLVQVVMATARLVSTPKYFPLRFHCCKILTDVSRSTGTFIPVLPFYLEVINTFNFNKKAGKASMKPIEFNCILKLSKSQLAESGFKDSTIEGVYSGMLAYLSDNSFRIGFPELVTPAVFQVRDFIKKCKVTNYTKKLKQLLDKVVANQKFIETRRRTVSFGIGDHEKIKVWEAQVERDGTPLTALYNSWRKTAESQYMKRVTQQEKLDDYQHIPTMNKKERKGAKAKDADGPVNPFEDDDDDGDSFDEEEQFKLKEERGKGNASASDDEEEEEEASDEEGSDVEMDGDEADAGDSSSEDEEDVRGEDVVEDLKLADLESDGSDVPDEFDLEDGDDDDDDEDESDSGEDDESDG